MNDNLLKDDESPIDRETKIVNPSKSWKAVDDDIPILGSIVARKSWI